MRDAAKISSPQQRESLSIPVPAYSNPGDRIETITISRGGYLSGSVFVLKMGARHLGQLHGFRADGRLFFGYLTGYAENRYHVKSISPFHPSGWYKAALVGCVLEHYPNGLSGVRWVVYGGVSDAEAFTIPPASDTEKVNPPARIITLVPRRRARKR